MHTECTIGRKSCDVINEGLFSNKSFTKLKHMAIQLNTFLIFLGKVKPDVIWIRGQGPFFECTAEENE